MTGFIFYDTIDERKKKYGGRERDEVDTTLTYLSISKVAHLTQPTREADSLTYEGRSTFERSPSGTNEKRGK